MITHQITNLRSDNWKNCISSRDLRERIEHDRQNGGPEWKVTPWQRNPGGCPMRSYLVTSQDGAIYAIFFQRSSDVN